jgi:hypothetical protein
VIMPFVDRWFGVSVFFCDVREQGKFEIVAKRREPAIVLQGNSQFPPLLHLHSTQASTSNSGDTSWTSVPRSRSNW